MNFQRYSEILDTKRISEFVGSEQGATVRKNDLKAGEGFENRLQESFGEVVRAEWNPSIFRIETEKPGKTYMHWRGEYYVQEESASVPVRVLDPNPGDSVLDMCAAPGGKTSQIASMMVNEAEILANDSSASRIKSLQTNIYRTGSAAATINKDGRNFPGRDRFDKILVDAPCTADGDRIRRGEKLASQEESKRLAELQYRLLEAAERLLKPEGRIVYSTCTISPTENEAVLERILNETELELKAAETEAPHNQGVRHYDGDQFDLDDSKVIRILPNHLDSGVMTCARLG